MLAKVWKEKDDPSGYWLSEKFDGVRGIWTGTQLLSRNGKGFNPPTFWTNGLPMNIQLDGELSMGRGEFQRTVSVVRGSSDTDRWKAVRFHVFDTISADLLFEDRIKQIPETHPFIDVVPYIQCTGRSHLQVYFDHLHENRGEGVMLRAPCSNYEYKRSSKLLKLKRFLDDEATVIGYVEGKGRFVGKMGAVIVKNQRGSTFRIGTGFTTSDRENPPAIGNILTYKYQELTNGGKPRFPVYLRQQSLD